MAIFRVSKGVQSALANTDIAEGTLRFTTDTHELYVDIDDATRVHISSFITIATESALANISAPITSKLYYVTETNLLYHYNSAKLEWEPLGKGIYAELDTNGAVSKANTLTNSRTFTFTGDVTGSGSFDGSDDVSIKFTLANSGVTAGSYGEEADKTLSNGEAFTIPYVTFNAKGLATDVKNITVTLGSIKTAVASTKEATDTKAVSAGSKVYVNTVFNGKVIGSFSIIGSGGTSISSDDNGNVTVYSSSGDTTNSSYKAGEALAAGDLIVLNRNDSLWYKVTNTSKTYLADGNNILAVTPVAVASGATVVASVTGYTSFKQANFTAKGTLTPGAGLWLKTSTCSAKTDTITLSNTITTDISLDKSVGYIRIGKYIADGAIILGYNFQVFTGEVFKEEAYLGASYLGTAGIVE